MAKKSRKACYFQCFFQTKMDSKKKQDLLEQDPKLQKRKELYYRSGGQEVKFHEIKIQLFHEIKITIMRLKFYLFMRSKLTIIFSQFWSGGWHFDHEIETQKSIITNFDLMIVLVTNKLIMRLKLKIKHY